MNRSPVAGWKKTFFIIWFGQAFSLFGSELVQFALVWYLTKQTGSASVLAMASFVALLPKVFLSPFIGALIDRWNRQRVMIFADLAIACFTLILVLVFWLGEVQIWHIYAIMFMRALGSSFHWPSMQASTSLMVPKEKLSSISGWNQTLQGAMGILAPMAAALLLDVLPMQGILAIDIITAFIAITPLLFVTIPQPVQISDQPILSGARDLLRDVKQGFQYLSHWKGMLYLIAIATILNFLLNPGYTFTPLLVKDYFNLGAFELSLIEAMFSIGMIAGGLVLGAWGGFKKKILTILVGILGGCFQYGAHCCRRGQSILFGGCGHEYIRVYDAYCERPFLCRPANTRRTGYSGTRFYIGEQPGDRYDADQHAGGGTGSGMDWHSRLAGLGCGRMFFDWRKRVFYPGSNQSGRFTIPV